MAQARSAPRLRVLGVLCVAVVLACAGLERAGLRYEFFGLPLAEDPWSPKIAAWQSRARASAENATLRAAPASVSESGTGVTPSEASPQGALRRKYEDFRERQKRALAQELADWIQSQSRHHYRPDGPIDHWATLEETFEHDGDDCDGLELLVYHLLRDLGFGRDEVFRSIVYRPADGQHHMVTLWFDQPDDPWVIDPTGAMTSGMPRLSAVPGWIPLKVFSETQEYTARAVRAPVASAP